MAPWNSLKCASMALKIWQKPDYIFNRALPSFWLLTLSIWYPSWPPLAFSWPNCKKLTILPYEAMAPRNSLKSASMALKIWRKPNYILKRVLPNFRLVPPSIWYTRPGLHWPFQCQTEKMDDWSYTGPSCGTLELSQMCFNGAENLTQARWYIQSSAAKVSSCNSKYLVLVLASTRLFITKLPKMDDLAVLDDVLPWDSLQCASMALKFWLKPNDIFNRVLPNFRLVPPSIWYSSPWIRCSTTSSSTSPAELNLS